MGLVAPLLDGLDRPERQGLKPFMKARRRRNHLGSLLARFYS